MPEIDSYEQEFIQPSKPANATPDLIHLLAIAEAKMNALTSHSSWRANEQGQELLGQALNAIQIARQLADQTQGEAGQMNLPELIQSERVFLKAVLEQMPSGVIIAEAPSGRIIQANQQAAKIWQHQFIPGESISEYEVFKGFHPDGRLYQPEEQPLARSLQAGEVISGEEIRYRHGDGTYGTILVSSSPVYNPEGKMTAAVVAFSDVTGHLHAAGALLESERRFRALADGTPVMIWVTDASGAIEFTNRAYMEFFGVKQEEVQSNGWQPLVHPEDVHSYVGVFMDCLKEQRPFRAQARVRRNDGEWRWVESQGQPRLSASGEFLGIAGSSLDITERMQAEEALRESEELRRLAMEAAEVGTWEYDFLQEQTFWDKRTRAIFGISQDEPATLEKGFSIIHPDDRERARAAFEHASDPASEGVYEVEKRIVHPDGTVRWVTTRGQIYFEGQGAQRRAVRLVGAIIDVSERRKAEEALRESEARFRSVLENSQDVIYRRNLKTDRYDYLSPVVEQVLGFSMEEMNAMGIDQVMARIHPDDRELVGVNLAHAIQVGQTKLEYRFEHKDGNYRWLADNVTIIPDVDGQPLYRVGTVRDISGIKQAEDELLTLNFELEERVAERTEELLEMQRRLIDGLEAERSQLAREIHDGPMQEIYALSYRLAGVDPNLSTEASQEEIQAINKELIRINNSLRAISQELLPSTLSKFGLDNAIRDHIERIQPANPELQISLDLSEDRDSLDKPVRLALYRIYQTAITNVIRHAQAEKVAIRFYQDKSSYVLEVEDDGTGFEVPTRFIDLAREGHLGLASAKERAQSAGGKMELHSRPDEGTLLRVVIPAHL